MSARPQTERFVALIHEAEDASLCRAGGFHPVCVHLSHDDAYALYAEADKDNPHLQPDPINAGSLFLEGIPLAPSLTRDMAPWVELSR